jgi:tRNA threonylcarbamoyladenosine biosynthesis protein TsaB
MITLALETTSAAGSVAVCRETAVLAEQVGDPARTHGERLPTDVLAVLQRAGLALDDVDLFAVASGPGAFTGLRIGIATMQGLAFALGRPAVGISALKAQAHLAVVSEAIRSGDLAAVWMDAARGEVFAALYEILPGGGLRPCVPESVGAPEEVLASWRAARVGRSVYWAGGGAARYVTILEREAGDAPRVVTEPASLARGIAHLGAAAHAEGRSGRPHAIQPLYLRRPDAEIARARRSLPGGAGGS